MLLGDTSQWWHNTSYEHHNGRFLVALPQRAWVERIGARTSHQPGLQHGRYNEESGRVAEYERDLQVGVWSRLFKDGQLPELVEVLDIKVHRGAFADSSDVLKKSIAEKGLVQGSSRVHALAVKMGYQSNTLFAKHIIRLYASHGRLEEIRQVINEVAAADHQIWASVIWAHARHGQPTEAIKLYRLMRQSAVKPDNHIFVAVLKACATAKDLFSSREVHADILGTAHKPNMFVGTSLVNAYAKSGSLEEARRVFDNLPSKNVVTWNAMLAGYAQHGLFLEALDLYATMQLSSPVNHVTFVCLLHACASVGALHEGKHLHAQIAARGLLSDVVVGSCLVDMYAKCRSLDDARNVFDKLPTKNLVTWNSMIAGYAHHGRGDEAFAIYATMERNGIQADHVTFASLLQACTSIRDLQQGQNLHMQIRQRKLESNMVLGSCLVKMYSKCGSVNEARRVFDQLPMRDYVTWTAMIAGYAQHGPGQEALALFARMQLQGMTAVDYVTFVCLLQACASSGALHQGKQLHAQIQERELEGDLLVGSTLVYMYGKCGSPDNARTVFDRLPRKNVVTWNALLTGYAENSDARMAMQCFSEMCQQGIVPDDTTFICLLVACSHSGLVHEGQKFLTLMVEEHGIAPTVNHYNCMVDIFARSGHLDEAENMLQTMPFENNPVGWKSLLSACKSLGDIGRGRRCFDMILQLEPTNASAYVLLGNIYANAGMWRDVQEIETMRKLAGAWKKPGKAGIEVKNKVHEFMVGEERSDISAKLRRMSTGVKEGGHVPLTELVLQPMSEQEKEDALCGHAEKLALAYGLLNTPDGTTLLITKNLRMCNDCHSSTKVISSIEKRDIIVRDSHRVHRFTGGHCSCGDRQ